MNFPCPEITILINLQRTGYIFYGTSSRSNIIGKNQKYKLFVKASFIQTKLVQDQFPFK